MLLTLVGCQHHDWESFDQHEDEFSARRLYQPLVSGQNELLSRLPNVLGEPVVFALDRRDVHRIEDRSVEQSEYWDQDKVVFFDIDSEPSDEVQEWVWFNPRRLRVEHVTFDEEGVFSVHRSLPEGRQRSVRQSDLDIFRFNFHLADDDDDDTAEQMISLHSARQLTFTDDPELSPVFTDDGNTLLYLATRESNHHQIMVKRLAETSEEDEIDSAVPLIANQTFDAQYPWMLPDGRLAFAANVEGHYRMYQVEDFDAWNFEPLDPQSLDLLQYPIPNTTEDDEYIFGSMGEDGIPMPLLLKLPEQYDLATLLSMVEVYNPRINEKRALLAASLIEARMPKLDNWPILNFGLEYEQAADIFFDLPRIAAGDTLSKEIVRLLVGFTQPLLRFKRNAALSEAGMWQARVAADLVDNEINERIAEASELYFEAAYLEALIDIQSELIAVSDQKTEFFTTLRDRQEAIRLQLMAVAQVRDGQVSERHFSAERLTFLKARLKEVSGIPATIDLRLAGERYRLSDMDVPSLGELKDIAQLNHPRLNVARHQLSRSFYLREAGHRIRPSMNFAGNYVVSGLDFDRVAGNTIVNDSRDDEVVGLGLGASVPTASRRARKYHRGYWDHVINGQRLARDAEIRGVDTQLNEAYLYFKAAQWDKSAKDSSHAYVGEKLRVTRVQALGTPSGGLESASDLFRDANVSDRQGRFDQLSPYTVRMEFLTSYADKRKVEMDMGLRYVKLLREQGIARTAAKELADRRVPVRDRSRTSIWLWDTKRVLSSDGDIDTFMESLSVWKVKRVYAYLHSDSELLVDAAAREKLTLLLHLCRQQDVEVWALLGEPEWIQTGNAQALRTAMNRIRLFNAGFGSYEPRIAGVKLDLEPHSLSNWDSDASYRSKMTTNFLALLDQAQQGAGDDLPVWADLSVKLFSPEETDLLGQTLSRIDGATVMTYFDTENAILKWAQIAVDSAGLPTEIGVELSDKAPASDRITEWTPSRRSAFHTKLIESMSDSPFFSGIALHDYTGLSGSSNGDRR